MNKTVVDVNREGYLVVLDKEFFQCMSYYLCQEKQQDSFFKLISIDF